MAIKIQPQIHARSGQLVSIFYWEEDSVDPEILNALKRGETLRTSVSGGLSETRYGSLSWLLCAIDCQANIEQAKEAGELFWFDFIPDPPTLQREPFSQWLQLLQQQQQLLLCVPHQGKTYTLALASGEGLKQWVDSVQKSVQLWEPEGNSFNKAAIAIQKIVDEQKEQSFLTLKQQFSSDVRTQLLQSCSTRILAELSPEHPLHAVATNLEELANYLYQWAAKVPVPPMSNQFFAHISDNLAEEVCKDFLFSLECFFPTNRPKPMLPIGTTDSGTWAWKEIPGGDTSHIWMLSKQYRSVTGKRNKPEFHSCTLSSVSHQIST